MNAIDALLAVILLLGAFNGSRRGFVVAALHLLAIAASLAVAFVGSPYVAALLEERVPSLGVWAQPLGFVAGYLVCYLLLAALAFAVIRAVPGQVHAGAVNKALGVIPGLLNGLLTAVIVSLVLLAMPLGNDMTTVVRASAIASRLARPAEWLEAKLGPIFEPAAGRALQALTLQPESRTRVDLGFKVTGAKERPDLEARMLDLVNAERAKQGLPLLKPDPQLTEVARSHSRDMFARGYFAHVGPDGEDAFDRMRRVDVRFLTAGENLALAPTLESAHRGLMNSPGHRANLLRPQFGRVGIGVLDGGKRGLMVTQEFRN